MASKAVYINEAGIRRRWNPRDVQHHHHQHDNSGGNDWRGPAPNVHNSLAIQKKHVASMYRLVGRPNKQTKHSLVENDGGRESRTEV